MNSDRPALDHIVRFVKTTVNRLRHDETVDAADNENATPVRR